MREQRIRVNGSRVFARIVEVAFLALCPALALWVMHFSPIAQKEFADPYVYTGYINNFEDLFQRYGVTYYGVRFGLVAPAQLAAAVFGPVGGYVVLRYAYCLIAGLPFYLLVRQRFGRPAAVASISLLLTSPYFARTILWDHPDAAGVPFLFAAICLFLIEGRRRLALDASAAICAGMALHSNVFVAAPLAIIVGTWTLLSVLWRRDVRAIASRLTVVLSGIGGISALAAGYYRWRVDVADIFSITFNKSLELASGGMVEWRTPGIEWVTREWHVLTPVALALLALAAWSKHRSGFEETVMWLTAAATTAFFYVMQFGLGGNSLELFYYFSYLLPSVFLLVALIVGALLNGAGPRSSSAAVALLVSAAIGPWILYSLGRGIAYPTRIGHYLAAVGAGAAALLLWRWVPRFRPATAVCAAAAFGFMLFSSFARPVYARMIDSRVQAVRSDVDVYRVALQLIEIVPRWSANPGAVGFWYSNEASPIQSIQSTYLFGFSRVQGEGRGLPHLEAADLQRLGRMQLKWLVLLAETEGELASGLETLSRIGIEHEPVDRRVLRSGTYAVHFELLELRPHTEDRSPPPP
ncbi:MAG: hypothetical protein ACRD3G_15495 [Vicinamibacterales bacterium]